MVSVSFQVISWEADDVCNDDTGDLSYRITLFGRNESGRSVACKTFFEPYFFVEIPKHWQKHNATNMIHEKISKQFHSAISSVAIVNRKRFMGFTNNELFSFARVVFKSKKAWRMAYYILRKDVKLHNKIYEANIDPILRFIHIQKIESAGWVDTTEYVEVTNGRETSCDVEINVPKWKNVNPLQKDIIGPFVTASFDIETYSQDRSFPDPESLTNVCPVIQIATTYQRYGESEPFRRHLLTLKTCPVDSIESVEIECMESERSLLIRWSKSIQEYDPDILVGYNIWKFDLSYIFKRVRRLNLEHLFNINRFIDEPSQMYSGKFSSSAYGDNEYLMVYSKGRMQIDLLELYKREHKLVKYSLNAVSEHFLGDVKVDMPIPEMFNRYERGTPDDIQAIGKYCVKDTELPLRLMSKLNNIPNLVEMAKATCVPMNFLIERGQQIKVFSQIAKQTRLDNMLVVTIQDGKTDDSFVGATVLNAKKGHYMDQVVTGLDFASLYPTIMRAHNLCYNTIVLDPKYSTIEGVEYETISWEEAGGKQREYQFAQTDQGVLPKILENLAKSRKQAKKDMAEAPDLFMKSVYNSKQLAFKVSMNSIYGFCAAYMLPCQPISACVTTIGRNMIEKTKTLVEEWYPKSEVIYGDSVTGDTPLLLKNKNGPVTTQRIDELFETFDSSDGNCGTAKEYVDCENIFVWSDIGFTKIKRIMRHSTTKRLYRVLTPTGIVDVTEDHSLLLEDGSETRPVDVSISTKLLHSMPVIEPFVDKDFGEPGLLESKFMGYFFGKGKYTRSIHENKSDLFRTQVLVIPSDDQSVLRYLKSLPPFDTRIVNNKLVLSGELQNPIIDKYRNTYYNQHGDKIVPDCILNASDEVVQQFFDGYYMARGSINKKGGMKFTCEGKEGTSGIVLLCQRLGYTTIISGDKDLSVFHITCTRTALNPKNPKTCTGVKYVEDLGLTTTYVYDLETENHHFHVGPGDLIVHNTDSVMVIFDTGEMKDKAMLEESFRLGEEAADRISKTFKYPIELEFEKCYWPYLLFSKKRYAGLMYTNTEKPDYIDAKGIQLVRRDNANFVREISKKVLHMIMYDRAIYEAMECVQEEGRRLLAHKVPLDQLIVSKSLRKDYKNDKQPHVSVAKKIESRLPGSGPKCGERVPYVFMDTNNNKHLQCEKAEDPTYVVENHLEHKIDVLYYLKHSLISPVESLFELFIDDAAKCLFGEMITEYEKKKANQSSITCFFVGAKPKQQRPSIEKRVADVDKKPVKPKKKQLTLSL